MTQAIQIADRRRHSLVRQWVQEPDWVLAQVDSPGMLQGRAHDISGDAEAQAGRVGVHRLGSVIMLEGGTDRDRTWSVWARASFSNYKAAYLAFLRHAYRVTASADDLPGYQVDHLSNRAYAPSGQEFIRLEAIPTAINHAWGVNFESRRTENTDARPMHKVSWASCAKLGGQLPPAGPNDTAGINRLATWFASLGMDPDEARGGVTRMLQHAYWRR